MPLQRLADRSYEHLEQSFNALVFMFFALPAVKAREPRMRTHFNAVYPNVKKARGNYDQRVVKAAEFAEWASKEDRTPMLQLALVNACSAYENALKQISVAIALGYKPKETKSHGKTVFLGSNELLAAHKQARQNWHVASSSTDFLRQHVYLPNVLPANVNLPLLDDGSSDVQTVESAFLVRNDCVHNMGRSSKQIELCDSAQVIGHPVVLTPKTLFDVSKSMLRMIEPFNPQDRAWNAWGI